MLYGIWRKYHKIDIEMAQSINSLKYNKMNNQNLAVKIKDLWTLSGIITPLVMWILKKDNVKFVDDTGKKLISFQITWTLILYIIIIASKGRYIPFNFSLLDSFSILIIEFSIVGIIILLLYLYNIILIILNIRKSQKGLKNKYLPTIPFLK